ncbi:pilus assembly protein TadG-related protein [Rhizobium sp. RCAM05350]|nr:pilus assembly protein TadG-related protein [Rhizobium sp. RCAM05350]
MAREALKHRGILTNTSGNISISTALVLPLVVLSLGLGIDFGYLTLQKRRCKGSPT